MSRKTGSQAHYGFHLPRLNVPKEIEAARLNQQRDKTAALMKATAKEPRKGSNTRFSDDEVRQIRKDIESMGVADTARKWGCAYNLIMHIDQGVNYSRVK